MIPDFFLNLIYFIVSGILNLLPNAQAPVEIGTNFTSAGNFLANLNGLFPVFTFLIILGLILGIDVAILGYKGTMWAIKKIPGIS